MKHALKIASVSALLIGLSACDQIMPEAKTPAPETPVAETEATPAPTLEEAKPSAPQRPAAEKAMAQIDWEAARKDLASLPGDERDTSFQVASGQTAPPVPVLLPTGIVVAQGAGNQPRFQPLTDGYYAAYPGIDYDIIVNGTNEVLGKETAVASEPDLVRFQSTGSGAMVSFSRYGADYLIEFECKNVEGEAPDCISEEDAVQTARDLIIAGTR